MSTPPFSVSRKSLSLSSLDEEAKEASKYQKKTEEVFLGRKTREMTSSEGTFDTEKGGDITDISLGLRAVGLHSDEPEAALPIPVESSDEKYLSEMTAIQQLPEASKLSLEVTDDPDLFLGAVGGVGFGEVHESVEGVGESVPEATEVDLEKLIESQESKELEAEEYEFKFLVGKVKSALKDNFVSMFGDNPSFIPWITESSQSSMPCDLESPLCQHSCRLF
ncbi:hypothetical protein GCM10023116_19060 [Kistimonas scapharcae]|uniref:Uncharacterized protein n=1 Tax=Kistimonas scapharcae TaxID=1036133 RepID=A0ABP8V2V2_9GAMM